MNEWRIEYSIIFSNPPPKKKQKNKKKKQGWKLDTKRQNN